MKTITKLWIGLGILITLTPLGLILPKYFKAGPAWGEWNTKGINWPAPMQDYGPSYVVSAALGVLAITGVILLIGVFFGKRE